MKLTLVKYGLGEKSAPKKSKKLCFVELMYYLIPIHSDKIIWKSYLLKYGTTWNSLQQAMNDLKRPTMSKKRPETTWNNLERAKNYLKQPTTHKKQHETNFKEQILTSWNPLLGK